MKLCFITGAMGLTSLMVLVSAPTLQGAPAYAGAGDSMTKQSPNSKNDASQKLSQEATIMLQQVGKARQAVTAKQTPSAISHIDQAMADRNHLASMSKTKGGSTIVPLYSELDDSSTLGPILSERKGKPQPNTSAPITVDDASAQYTFVGLDLDKTKSRLEAAKKALNNNNNQAASDSLAAIGSDLVVETEEMDLPLLAARENLGIARSAVKNGKYQEASAALKEASIAIDKYSNESSVHHADEAKQLKTKIDTLSTKISQHHTGAEGTIDQWWNEVDSWFTHTEHNF